MVDLTLIREAADRVARSHGLEVVDVEFAGAGKRSILRVYIEKNATERARLATEDVSRRSETGTGPAALDQLAWVTHEDCEGFSREFGTLVEVEGIDPSGEYTLEVSSPGLDRKLRDQADYRRFLGSLIKVGTNEPVAGNRLWQGRLTEVRAEGIVLATPPSKTRAKSRKGSHAVTVGASSHEDGKSAVLEIAWSNIDRARLVPEF